MISKVPMFPFRVGWPGGGRIDWAFARPVRVAERARVARGRRRACMAREGGRGRGRREMGRWREMEKMEEVEKECECFEEREDSGQPKRWRAV